uniref:Uncharacterized protein n=1 Tax=viral metagenome TaxID=1070528 RepID=A0A6M3JZ23_9ZZZZ
MGVLRLSLSSTLWYNPVVSTPDQTAITLSRVLPDVLSSLSQLSTSQQSYLVALAQYGSVTRACRIAEIQSDTVSQWRCPSSPVREVFNKVEGAIRQHRGTVSVALARQALANAAALAAQRVVERATQEPQSDRQMVVAQRAGEYVLRAVGIGGDATPSAEGEERLDVVALRIWRRVHAPQPPEALTDTDA